MQLLQLQLTGVGPFDGETFRFCDDAGAARAVTVVHGGGGVGKTTLLSAIATTRPGYAVVQPARGRAEGAAPHVSSEWGLGQDDADRPHSLRVTTPSTKRAPDDEASVLQRREQALFDRLARSGGFAFVALPSVRWFSRQPILLNAPLRTVARYDVRSPTGLEDATRADLARETKQALAYAELASALARTSNASLHEGFDLLGSAMRATVQQLVALAGFGYDGLDPCSFEPIFVDEAGRGLPFDSLPTRARHLVAFAALPTRTLWAAYPGRDPRESEGVVVIDEVDQHLDPVVQSGLVAALRAALPTVQWILTTTSPTVAGSCESAEVLALRRLPDADRVELFTGSHALTH